MGEPRPAPTIGARRPHVSVPVLPPLPMAWPETVFLHWPIREGLDTRVPTPRGAALDRWDGRAWLTLAIQTVALPGRRVLLWPRFRAANLRTYVTVHGRPAVHFLSITSTSGLYAAVARPMCERAQEGHVALGSGEVEVGHGDDSFAARVDPYNPPPDPRSPRPDPGSPRSDPSRPSAPDSASSSPHPVIIPSTPPAPAPLLHPDRMPPAEWLLERYVASSPGGALVLRVRHRPWQVVPANARVLEDRLVRPWTAGDPALAHVAAPVQAWVCMRVRRPSKVSPTSPRP